MMNSLQYETQRQELLALAKSLKVRIVFGTYAAREWEKTDNNLRGKYEQWTLL